MGAPALIDRAKLDFRDMREARRIDSPQRMQSGTGIRSLRSLPDRPERQGWQDNRARAPDTKLSRHRRARFSCSRAGETICCHAETT